jgi:peptidoglycan/xylan/chitin deacetylase (PgdA/CDA1 family)
VALAAGPALWTGDLAAQSPTARRVAVTIDDLPAGGPWRFDVSVVDSMTAELLAALGRHRVPAIGFVIGAKVAGPDGGPDPARVAVLERWLDAGLELGNHSYSHHDLHRVPVEVYVRDALRGDSLVRSVLVPRGAAPRFFRHPLLHTGQDAATRRTLEDSLAAHGYRVAPVTIDNYDYLFANAYDQARAAQDGGTMRRIEREYLAYMQRVVVYYETQSVALLGREVAQTLLLHANALNARTFDAFATWLAARGYGFVSLETALEDPAYGSPDEYYGPGGITWLHRWALTQGKRGAFFAGEPEVPDWIGRP